MYRPPLASSKRPRPQKHDQPVTRAAALALREGGVGTQPKHKPAMTALERAFLARNLSHQHQLVTQRAVAGAHPGALAHFIGGIPSAVYRNPIVGKKGAIGGIEDLAQTFNPIALERALQKTVQHPLASRSAKGISAGIVVGGPGGDVAGELTRPRTRAEAEARLSHLERQQEVFHNKVAGRYKSVLPEEQRRLNVAKGVARKAAGGEKVKGGKKAARVEQPMGSVADTFLQGEVDKAVAKYPNNPHVKTYLANVDEANQLREALSSQHLPGEEPVKVDYGTVRVPAPTRGPLVEPAKVADVPNIPGVERTPAELRGVVGKSLPAMRMAQREIAKMRSVERKARVARGEAARAAAGGGEAGHLAFLHEMKGTMPTATFERLRKGELSKSDLDELISQIEDHPGFKPFHVTNATEALRNSYYHGKAPRRFEIKLLQQVFGDEAGATLAQGSLYAHAIGILGIPRSVMASADVSAPFRQNLMGMAIEPRMAFRNMPRMYRTLFSEETYRSRLTNIHEHPDYQMAIDDGLALTELANVPARREEAFPSQYAEQIPVVGHVVRGSGRSYTLVLDEQRFEMYVKYINILRKKGIDPESRPELRGVAKIARGGHEYPFTYGEGIAKFVNSATGRGSLPAIEKWGPMMNVIFFSPRLMYSRINFLDPTWYFRLDPLSRQKALKGVVRLAGTAGGTFALAAYLGAQIGHDPRSADFAKIRLGNTRLDILGGFQQYVRFVAQMITGQQVSSSTGKLSSVGSGFGDTSRYDISENFLAGKWSPPASFVRDLLKGTNFAGQPFSIQKALVDRITPLVAQDAWDLYHNTDSKTMGAFLAAAGYAISAHGIGMQTYKAPKKKVKRYGGGGSSGPSNPLLTGVGGGSNPLLPGGGSSSNPLLP